MSDITFSPGISDEVRANTQKLFDWLADSMKSPLSPTDVNAMLGAGTIDLAARTQNNDQLLHRAARIPGGEFCRDLLALGADIEALNNTNETPLIVAAQNGNSAMCEALLAHGANVHATDHNQISALHYAAKEGTEWTCETLIKAGADINARDYILKTPLHFASPWPRNTNAEVLLRYGANLKVTGLQEQRISNFPVNHTHDEAFPVWNRWHNGSLQPEELDFSKTMLLLNVWSLTEEQAPVPRFEHLEAIFSDARWKDEHAEHKLELIQQIPGLSSREQMFLMGGHARAVIQKQNAGKEMER